MESFYNINRINKSTTESTMNDYQMTIESTNE